MSKINSKTKKLIIIGSSVLLSLIVMFVFINTLSNKSEKNLEKGNLNKAISGYELVTGIYKTEHNMEMLEIAKYEKDAIAKINTFYEEMQRVKKEIEYASDNYQIMEVTKSVSEAFYQFDQLDTGLDSGVSLYVEIVKSEPEYKIYKEDYLTGQAVITKKTDNILDSLLGNITKDSVLLIIDNIFQMERPEKCFTQEFKPGSIEDRTNMRILNSKYRFMLGIVLIIIFVIILFTIYCLKLISSKEKKEKEKEVIRKLKNKIQMISSGFKNNIISYEDAISKLDEIKSNELVKEEAKIAINNIQQLHISQTAYKKGMELKKFHKLDDAVKEFKKVIESDANYDKAINEIDKILIGEKLQEKPQEKPQETLEEEKQVITKKKPRPVQDVEVVDIRQYTDSINTNFIAVKIKNNTTDKRIRSYEVGFVGFNLEGEQVNVGLVGGKPVGIGRASNQDILPGETVSSGGGWYIDNLDVKYLIACVSKVEFYDQDEAWKNPEYNKWFDKYSNGKGRLKSNEI